MKPTDLKRHLSPYSIYRSRKTTINHAFASALAPCDLYDAVRVAEALALLGQDPDADLRCVYCDDLAETWDHLVGLVKQSELHGYGHQLGNLVPCCKSCNSKKGNRDWRSYLRERIADDEEYSLKEQRIGAYLNRFAVEVDVSQAGGLKAEWQRYNEIKREILRLMQEADQLAARLRMAIKQSNHSRFP